MEYKPAKELTKEVHQGLFGIAGTEDTGLIGDVKEIKKTLKDLNGSIRDNTLRSKQNSATLVRHDYLINNSLTLPFGKKWFWALLAIVILSLAGLNITELIGFLGN